MLEGAVTTGEVLVWFLRYLGMYVSDLWAASCTGTVYLVFLSYVKVNNVFLLSSLFSALQIFCFCFSLVLLMTKQLYCKVFWVTSHSIPLST